MEICELIDAIKNERIRITDHAEEEAVADNLSIIEIFESVYNGEIIEAYPKDKPFPSCLVLGNNTMNEPIHSVWAYNKVNFWAVLITVYRPDEERWIDGKIRRNKK